MPNLPHEIILDILSRLPAKSLVRFKCVSKPWQSMISDPQFAQMHLKRPKENDRVFLTTNPLQSVNCEVLCDDGDQNNYDDNNYNNNGTVVKYSYPVSKVPEYEVEVIGSCDGLLCLVFDYDNIVMWNPTTLASKELSKHNAFPDGLFFYGLGYDSCADDYKVIKGVCSNSTNGSKETKVEVLALKNNTWTKTLNNLSTSWHALDARGIFSNGSLYWLAKRENDANGDYVIVSFDMAEERFEQFVTLPDLDILDANLAISGDCLVLLCDCQGTSFQAWKMNKNRDKISWTRLFCVPTDTLPDYENTITLLGFMRDRQAIMDIDGRELVMYNPKEERFKNIVIANDWDSFESALYVESLVSPNRI